jgi:hypothetical protein
MGTFLERHRKETGSPAIKASGGLRVRIAAWTATPAPAAAEHRVREDTADRAEDTVDRAEEEEDAAVAVAAEDAARIGA